MRGIRPRRLGSFRSKRPKANFGFASTPAHRGCRWFGFVSLRASARPPDVGFVLSRGRSALATLLALLLLVVASSPANADDAGRPNILWLIAEDIGPELGCTGTPEVWTPILDRLGIEGVRYARAYTTAPVCSASRSAIMTGMYQTTIGAHNHRSHRDDGYRLPAGVRLVTDRLRDAGYFAANLRALPPALGFRGTGKTDWNFATDRPPFDSDRWADLAEHQPFIAQLNFAETHRPFEAPRRADPAQVALPPYYPDHPIARADWAAYLDSVSELDRKVGLVLDQLARDGLADRTVVIVMGDHGQTHVRGKQFCYEEGLHIPLFVRVPPGLPQPAGYRPGVPDDRLIEAIDVAPTLLAMAGIEPPPGMQGRAFLGPNVGEPRRYAFGARDRCDETVFRLRTVRDDRYRYIRNFTPARPFLQANAYKERSYPVWNLLKTLGAQGRLLPAQQILTAPTMPPEELYDLWADPHEVRNLITSDVPDVQAARDRLRLELDRWLTETHDQGATPEPPEVAAALGATRPETNPNQPARPR